MNAPVLENVAGALPTDVTTGVPLAIASSTGGPKPSYSDV